MKKEHIMQNAPSGHHRLIHVSVTSRFSAYQQFPFRAKYATAICPKLPYYLQNKTDVSSQPKSNTILCFD